MSRDRVRDRDRTSQAPSSAVPDGEARKNGQRRGIHLIDPGDDAETSPAHRDEPLGARKVLLVSYTFPPQYDVSARRTAKLCKYLPQAGWQPVVLTKDWEADVAPEDGRAYTLVRHPDALHEIPDVRIVRSPYQSHDNALRRLHRRLGGVYEHGGRDLGAAHDGADARHTMATEGETQPWSPRVLARRALSVFSPLFGDFPDAFRGWIAPAVRAGIEVVRQQSIDAICSVCQPATAHVVAPEIARQTGLPGVAQFDDL